MGSEERSDKEERGRDCCSSRERWVSSAGERNGITVLTDVVGAGPHSRETRHRREGRVGGVDRGVCITCGCARRLQKVAEKERGRGSAREDLEPVVSTFWVGLNNAVHGLKWHFLSHLAYICMERFDMYIQRVLSSRETIRHLLSIHGNGVCSSSSLSLSI